MEREDRKKGATNRRRAPRLERLESRELLSGLGADLFHHGLHHGLVHVLQTSGGGGGSGGGSTGSGGSSPSGGGGSGGGGNSGGSSSGGSGSSQVSQFQVPTPQAAAMGRYQVAFHGYYVVGPPQFQNQQARTVVNANAPSWQKGHQLFLSFNYAVPQDGSSVSPVTITIKGPHPSPTGDSLVLDATIEPASQGQVLPTYMTWTVNGSKSGGIFAGASGQGTAELVYGRARGGGRAQVGSASVLIDGLVVRQNLPG